MTFTLTIECDNAAFERDPGPELARILKRCAADLRNGEKGRKVFDVNGNSVGAWELTNK